MHTRKAITIFLGEFDRDYVSGRMQVIKPRLEDLRDAGARFWCGS